jgi:hypothetical protein
MVVVGESRFVCMVRARTLWERIEFSGRGKPMIELALDHVVLEVASPKSLLNLLAIRAHSAERAAANSIQPVVVFRSSPHSVMHDMI